MEQQSLELSLQYRYMFVTDITNCFGQINPESIGWALARKDTPQETDENNELAAKIQHYLRAMQQGKTSAYRRKHTFLADCRDCAWLYRHAL